MWWRLKAFVKLWQRVPVWGDMTRKGFGKPSVAALILLSVARPVHGQSVRIAAWSSYEAVTASQDWSTAGAQLTLAGSRGHAGWIAGEVLGRFGRTDVIERLGGAIHPSQRLWLSAEAGTSRQPVFSPRNSWQADASVLVARRASAGVEYRRWNYTPGPVDIVIPHVTTDAAGVTWDLRAFLSRNPSQRTDGAFTLRATGGLSRRTTVSLLGGAGRESYLVGSVVRSLQTVTGVAGLRYHAANGLTLRLDASAIHSRPVLSRSGVAIGVERGF